MKIARILEVEAYTMTPDYPETRYTEYVVLNYSEFDEFEDFKLSSVAKKNRHLTLDSAKNGAYDQGYKSYVHKGRKVNFRESRNQKRYNMEYLS